MRPFFIIFVCKLFPMVIHSNLNDFILFLYVHMSRADENYEPNEMATIKQKIGGLFEKGTDVERKLYTAIREYNLLDKSKLLDLLKASFSHFNKDERLLKNNFYADLNEIMLADGKVEDSESKALKALKEIIEMNTQKSN